MKNALIILFTVVLCFTIFYKYSNINPRYDEVGAVQTILSAKYYNEQKVYKQYWDQHFATHSSFRKATFNALPYIIVPLRWTYAISIYPVIALFINDTDSIAALKFKGVIGFSLLNILGFILFSRILLNRLRVSLISYVFIALAICLGVDNIHYARSAMPYSLLLLGISIQLYAIININNYFFGQQLSRRRLYWNLFLFSFPVILNHQFIITYPFLLVFFALLVYGKRVNFKNAFFLLLIPSLLFFGDVLFLLFRSKVFTLHQNPGLSVLSNGIHGEYLLTNYSGIIGKLGYFVKNGALSLFYSVTGFYKTAYQVLAYLTGIFVCTYIVYATLLLYKTRSKIFSSIATTNKVIVLYILVNFFTFLLLIILQKLNLSPTRHVLFFSILFCLLLCLIARQVPRIINYIFFSISSLLVMFVFINNAGDEYVNSGFNSNTLENYSVKNNTRSIVIERCWMYPLFSNSLNKKFDLLYRCGPKVWNTDSSVRNKVIYVNRANETPEQRKEYIQSLIPGLKTWQCLDSVISNPAGYFGYNMYLYKPGN